MSELAKILAENQQEMFKLITSASKKTSNLQHLGDSDSEAENTFIAPT